MLATQEPMLAPGRRLLGDSPERGMLEDAIRQGPGGANNPEGRNQHAADGKEVNHAPVMVHLPPTPPQAKRGNTVGYLRRRMQAVAGVQNCA